LSALEMLFWHLVEAMWLRLLKDSLGCIGLENSIK